MKRWLVTGGAGFMGSDFIRFLLKKYRTTEVLNFDKLTYAGNLENLASVERNPRYHFSQGDIAKPAEVNRVFKSFRPDIVVNFAAESHNDRAIMDPLAPVMTNVVGTVVLLEQARKYKIKRYHQISSDEIYGSIEHGKFSETSPIQPNTPYSAPKAGGDLLVRSFWVTYHLPVTISRSCNNYGPHQYPEKLIPLFITNLIEGKKVPVYGDGQQVREWIFVRDHSLAIDTIIRQGQIGEVYNVGTGYEIVNLDLTKKILTLLGQDPAMIDFVKDRPGHDRRYAVNWSKLKRLGWRPTYDFERGLQDTVTWYQTNQDWWKKIKTGRDRHYYQKQYGTRLNSARPME